MMKFKSEKEFLAKYNVRKYKQLSVMTDILVISISDEEKK